MVPHDFLLNHHLTDLFVGWAGYTNPQIHFWTPRTLFQRCTQANLTSMVDLSKHIGHLVFFVPQLAMERSFRKPAATLTQWCMCFFHLPVNATLPSGNQTWQLEIPHLKMAFPLKPSFSLGFLKNWLVVDGVCQLGWWHFQLNGKTCSKRPTRYNIYSRYLYHFWTSAFHING